MQGAGRGARRAIVTAHGEHQAADQDGADAEADQPGRVAAAPLLQALVDFRLGGEQRRGSPAGCADGGPGHAGGNAGSRNGLKARFGQIEDMGGHGIAPFWLPLLRLMKRRCSSQVPISFAAVYGQGLAAGNRSHCLDHGEVVQISLKICWSDLRQFRRNIVATGAASKGVRRRGCDWRFGGRASILRPGGCRHRSVMAAWDGDRPASAYGRFGHGHG